MTSESILANLGSIPPAGIFFWRYPPWGRKRDRETSWSQHPRCGASRKTSGEPSGGSPVFWLRDGTGCTKEASPVELDRGDFIGFSESLELDADTDPGRRCLEARRPDRPAVTCLARGELSSQRR